MSDILPRSGGANGRNPPFTRQQAADYIGGFVSGLKQIALQGGLQEVAKLLDRVEAEAKAASKLQGRRD